MSAAGASAVARSIGTRGRAGRLHAGADPRPTLLAVGDLDAVKAAPFTQASIVLTGISDITPALLCTVRPDVVVSSLITRHFDCVELAERLLECRYEGRYCIIAEGIPRPDLVRAELQAHFPALEVQVGALVQRVT